MSALPILLLLTLAACAPRQEPTDSAATAATPSGPSDSGARGIIRVVGSAPVNVQVVLQAVEGSSIRLAGPLLEELRRLSGAELFVRGGVEPSPDPLADRQIVATGYEILSVDGRPVVMGEILSIAGDSARLRTEDGREVVLNGVPSEFEVGQKIWVQGPSSVSVQSYGTIRP